MDENKYKLKIFLWDQFIRPVNNLINRHTLQSLLISLIMVNFISLKSIPFFWIASIIVLYISVVDAIKYWESGEFMSHYRKEKYPEYRKALKEVKKKKQIDRHLEKSIEEPTKEEMKEAIEKEEIMDKEMEKEKNEKTN